MEEEETVSIVTRKELRRQKLMEFLAAKGRLKPSNPKPCPQENAPVKKSVATALQVTGKENKVPVNGQKCKTRKVPTNIKSSQQPATKPSFVVDKVNVKSSTLTGMQKSSHSSSAHDLAQSRHPQNSLTTKMYTVSAGVNPSAANLKKKSNIRTQPAGKVSFDVDHAALKKSNNLSSRRSCPAKTVTVRMSLGPMVKTRTGLTPAVVQPRHTQLDLMPVRGGEAPKNVRPGALPLLSVTQSKNSLMSQRKTLSNTILSSPAHQRTTVSHTAKTVVKTHAPNVSNNSKKSSLHNGSSCGLKSTFTSSAEVPAKPKKKVASQPTNTSTKQRSEVERGKNIQRHKVPPQAPVRPVSVLRAQGTSGGTQAAPSKPKACAQTDSKKSCSKANAPLPRMGAKTSAPTQISQTVPRSNRIISRLGTEMKTLAKTLAVPNIPQTVAKKPTAAQEERMRKLQQWREAKGISYKRPPMQIKPQVQCSAVVPQPFWPTMKEEDEVHSFICAVDRSLADCVKLLEEGCPAEQVKEVLSRLPVVAQKFAKYWICKARLMEQEGNLDVLPMFEEAVGIVLEPVDELRTVVFEILKKKDEIQAPEEDGNEESQTPGRADSSPDQSGDPMMTPAKPIRALIYGENGNSSVVKYKITATPGGPPSQQREPARVNGQKVLFFTPVRRSVRIERASLQYPASLQDHDLCVSSYNDLIAEEEKQEGEVDEPNSPSASDTPMYVYRENDALQDKVVVQLHCDDAAASSPPVCN